MATTRVQCLTYSDDDPGACFGEVREFAAVPRVGDFVALGGCVHMVIAALVFPADRDTEITVEIYTRELDQDEYLEAVRHPSRPSRHEPANDEHTPGDQQQPPGAVEPLA